MYRLAYRNFGDHEALIVSHSVVAASSVGVRWYEIRSPGGAPTIYQQGTYAPDSNYHWMPSIPMDKLGRAEPGFGKRKRGAARRRIAIRIEPLGRLHFYGGKP